MEREEEPVEFRKDLVSKLLHLHLEEDKTKVSGDAILLLAELLKVFVHEAASRAARQALSEDVPAVDIEHVEKILPQLLLDF
ncbi:centromere protein X [Bufo gargarizans]|uniref:centromere protein X n=1 Tax=Bufo gargarizans TaxID=30331 RepID=UPI001CF328C7|nr:centromere protein X [Bufo gargarizans]